MVRFHVVFGAVASALTLFAAGLPTARFSAETAEVVVAPSAPPSTVFAADLLTNFLSRALGGNVPLVTEPTEGRFAIFVGTNRWSRAVGLAPELLVRDSFCMCVETERAFIAGCDDPTKNLQQNLERGSVGEYERATVFGVYDFLERYAGCRFYFPGEMGTIVPRHDELVLPTGSFSVSPRMRNRRDSGLSRLTPYPGVDPQDSTEQGRVKSAYRLMLREQTGAIKCVHGQNTLVNLDDYRETHPEYFQLRKDGTRCVGKDTEKNYQRNQLCHTSAIWDLFVDAAVTKVRNGESCVDVMPQDGMAVCWCDRCQDFYGHKDSSEYTLASGYASELIWSNTVRVANAITAAGLTGSVAQMAYGSYRNIPSVDIPGNVHVVLAAGGPWSVAYTNYYGLNICQMQLDFIRSWSEKIGRPVSWLWTYPMKNYGRLQAAGVPQTAPRAYASFYNRAIEYIAGSYTESETGESLVQNYLNHYVFSRIAWYGATDVEPLLEEHHRLMFGPARQPMTRFFDRVEQLWIGKVAIPSVIGETEFGVLDGKPVNISGPKEKQLWTEIYTPEVIAELDGYLAAAAAAAAPGSVEARRVAWIRAEVFDRLVRGRRDYLEKTETVTTPVYTVTVNDGSRTAPVYLDELDVEVHKGGKVSTRPFVEACRDFADGPAVFRKKGTGWMVMSTNGNMNAFSGAIEIREGAVVVSDNGQLGACGNEPKVTVSPGATLALATSALFAERSLALSNEVWLSGSGVGGYGALMNLLGTDQDDCLRGMLVLADDAVLSGHSPKTIGFGDGSVCDLGGHTLKVWRGTAGGGRLVVGDVEILRPGAIEYAGVEMALPKSAVEYRPLLMRVEEGSQVDVAGGLPGATVAGFRKDGAGRVRLGWNAAVTGTLEIAEGAVELLPACRVWSLAAGLWKGIELPVYTNAAGEVLGLVTNANGAVVCADPKGLPDKKPAIMDNMSTLSNEVVTCTDLMRESTYPPWIKWGSAVWSGYLWNRASTNETWTFALAVCGRSQLYVDGKRLGGTDDNGRVTLYNKAMTPGPHKFAFKVLPRDYNNPGSLQNPGKIKVDGTDIKPAWGPNMGLAIDRRGRKSIAVSDYVFPENGTANGGRGGDGRVFTRDARDVGDFDADALAALVRPGVAYPHVVARVGTVLDLGAGNEYPLAVDTWDGVARVENGGLSVREKLIIRYSDVKRGGGLVIDGALTLGVDAVVEFDNEGYESGDKSRWYRILTARGGAAEFLGRLTCPSGSWRFRLSADGASVLACPTEFGSGLMLMFR